MLTDLYEFSLLLGQRVYIVNFADCPEIDEPCDSVLVNEVLVW